MPSNSLTVTIKAAACNPNYQGCHMQPQQLGQPHATLTVGAARHGLVGAGGVLGLRPPLRARGLGFALAVCTSPSRFSLCAHNNKMNSCITIKWIHLFCTAKINEFIYFVLQKKYGFIVYEFICQMSSYLYKTRRNYLHLNWTIDHNICTTTPPPCHLVFYNLYTVSNIFF